MNAWVRDALAHAGMTHQRLADILTGRGLGTYHRSMVQKMTTKRKVRMDEAAVISEVTGFPLPAPQEHVTFAQGYERLTADQRALVDALVGQLLAARDGQ